MTAPEWAVEKAARALWDKKRGWGDAVRWARDHPHGNVGVRVAEVRKQARAALDAAWPETTTEWRVTRKAGALAGQEVAFTDEREARGYLAALRLSGVDCRAGLEAREVSATEWRKVENRGSGS